MRKIMTFISCIMLLFPVVAQKKNNKIVTDSLAMEYFVKGVFQDNVLTLYAEKDYGQLNTVRKQEVLSIFVKEFPNCQIIVADSNNKEAWMIVDSTLQYIDQWKVNNLEIKEFIPIDSQKKKSGSWFYYIGGMLSGSKWHSSGTLSLRAGTFLYNDKIDIGTSCNLGYSKVYETSFVGDIGIDSRLYLHYRIKNINLAPYTGTGITWAFAPDGYFEWRLLAGGCWFIGPGSLDLGVQYGTKSKISCTVGYTFRPSYKKKQ